MRRLAAWLAAPALAGCMVGPNYQAPTLPAPQAYGEQAAAPQASAETADLARWWAQLGDPELTSLIERALARNLDLKTAVSRVKEAHEQVVVARAALFPQLNASAIAAHRDANNGGASAAASSAPGQAAGGAGTSNPLESLPRHFNLYDLGFSSSWEIDLFGGARRQTEAARAQAEGAEWEARDVQVELTAQVARAYLSLRQAQARKAQAQADIARIGDLLDLVSARAKAGVVTDLDVNQQRQALAARRAEVPQLDQQARSAIHALGVLLGEPPMALAAELSPAKPLPAAPQTLPVGLPSELLKRRPDLRAAERNLAAATAQIGVAVADRYPKLNLLDLAGVAANRLNALTNSRNLSNIALGQLSLPLFDAGRRRATVRAKEAEAEQADLAYRQAWLGALQEVEDALVAYAADGRREAALTEELRTARDTATLARARYQAGLTPFLDVLEAEAAVNQAGDQLVSARSAQAGDTVTLFTALGGGWTPG